LYLIHPLCRVVHKRLHGELRKNFEIEILVKKILVAEMLAFSYIISRHKNINSFDITSLENVNISQVVSICLDDYKTLPH